MKTKIFTLAIAILGFTTASFAQVAQNSSSTTAIATGTIITPINIAKGTDLAFGTVVTSATTSGSLVIKSDGTANIYTDVVAYSGQGASSPTPAEFNVSGDVGNNFAITVTNLPSAVTHTDGSATMTIGSWTSNQGLTFSGAGATGTGTLSSNGTASFKIGATLSVGKSQKAGEYKSTAFTVTVNYN